MFPAGTEAETETDSTGRVAGIRAGIAQDETDLLGQRLDFCLFLCDHYRNLQSVEKCTQEVRLGKARRTDSTATSEHRLPGVPSSPRTRMQQSTRSQQATVHHGRCLSACSKVTPSVRTEANHAYGHRLHDKQICVDKPMRDPMPCTQPDLQRSLSTYTTRACGATLCATSWVLSADGMPVPRSRN
jgi:hypothetical protein